MTPPSASFKNATLLYLRHNRIDELKAGDLTTVQQLQILDLSDSQITSIAAGSVSVLSKLKRLDLSDNRLSAVGAGPFASPLSSLELLRFHRYQLAAFNISGHFDRLFPNLRTLIVQDADFDCNELERMLSTSKSIESNRSISVAAYQLTKSYAPAMARIACSVSDPSKIK